jgi:hypothetical protein
MSQLTANILANLNWRPSVLKRPLMLADGIIFAEFNPNAIHILSTKQPPKLTKSLHEMNEKFTDYSRGCQWTTCQLCVWSGSNRNAVIFSLNTIAFFATGATLAVWMRNPD